MTNCQTLEGKVGYKGQRYEITGIVAGNRIALAWCNESDGGGLVAAFKKWPSVKQIKVKDLRPDGKEKAE